MTYQTFNAILEDSTDEGAREYARGMVWGECEVTTQSIGCANHIDTIEGVGIYYDYAGDYYFFTDETVDEDEGYETEPDVDI